MWLRQHPKFFQEIHHFTGCLASVALNVFFLVLGGERLVTYILTKGANEIPPSTHSPLEHHKSKCSCSYILPTLTGVSIRRGINGPLGHPRQRGWGGRLLPEGLASFHTSRRQHHWCIRQRPAWWHGEILGEILYNPKKIGPKKRRTSFWMFLMGLELPWVPDSGMEEPFKRWKMCMFDFFSERCWIRMRYPNLAQVVDYCTVCSFHAIHFCFATLDCRHFWVLFCQPWSNGMSQTLQMRSIAKHFHSSPSAMCKSTVVHESKLQNYKCTPLKFNMKPENDGFQVRNLLFTRGWFSGEPR